MASSQATSSDAPFNYGIPSQDSAALLQNDDLQTPWFMQQEFLDENMSSWDTSDIDWPSVYEAIAAAAPGLRDLIAQTPYDANGDTVQDLITPPAAQSRTSSEVVESINLTVFHILGPMLVDGRDSPVCIAVYTQSLPEPFLSANAGRPVAGGGTGARSTVSTLARRSKDCPLLHLCHICKRTYTRKSSLKDHLRTHANKREFVCDGPNGCGEGFNTQHLRLSHQKHCRHGAHAVTSQEHEH